MIADPDIELCRLAFVNRQADARERADRLKGMLMSDLALLRRQAEVHERKAEHYRGDICGFCGSVIGPGDWLFTDAKGFVVPLELAAAQTAALIATEARIGAVLTRLQALNDLLDRYGRKQLLLDGPTTELLAQIRKGRKSDPVLRLLADEKLEVEQVEHAREIASIVYHVIRGMGAKITRFDVKSDGDDIAGRRRSEQEQKDWLAWMYSFVYLPWNDRASATAEMVRDLCVDGLSLTELEAKYRMRKSKALIRIRDGLDRYGEIRQRVVRADPETISASPVPRKPAPGADLESSPRKAGSAALCTSAKR